VIVELSPEAAADLEAAAAYLAERSPSAAARFLIRFGELTALLCGGIVRGRRLRLKGGEKVFGWSFPPYRVYYRLERSVLTILRLYHGARRPLERRPREPRR
jgi:plasmid stabilization system protein ParE